MAAAHAAGSADRRRLMHLMKCTRQLSGPEDAAGAGDGAETGAGAGVRAGVGAGIVLTDGTRIS